MKESDTIEIKESASRVIGRSLNSRLFLTFSNSDQSGTKLSRRFHQGLFHLGKQYQEEEGLFLQVINPTAGLFSGDRFESEIEVQANAHATLFSPSATQVYQMDDKGKAIGKQFINLDENATLDWSPNSIVPHKNSRLDLSTNIYLKDTSTLVYTDIISPGRVAHGESLEFAEFSSKLSIYRNSRLLVRENFSVFNETDKKRWQMIQSDKTPYFATLWIFSKQLDDELFTTSHQDLPFHFDLGITQIGSGIFAVRMASPSQAILKKEISKIKNQLITPLQLNRPRI